MILYSPQDVYESIDQIDFLQLKMQGYNVILTDLDNTLATYSEAYPNRPMINLMKDLKALGFRIYLISNNQNQRLKLFSKQLNVDGTLAKAGKPKIKRMQEYLVSQNIDISKTIGIGDQLVTDIVAYNKLNIYSILVKTIDFKNQLWYTKINRLREKSIVKKIMKENKEMGDKIKKIWENA